MSGFFNEEIAVTQVAGYSSNNANRIRASDCQYVGVFEATHGREVCRLKSAFVKPAPTFLITAIALVDG